MSEEQVSINESIPGENLKSASGARNEERRRFVRDKQQRNREMSGSFLP